MSSRVGTAIPASASTAWSSAAVGFTRSIQTALSGSAESSGDASFFKENSEGTNTENMENPTPGMTPRLSTTTGHATTQQDLARFWQALYGQRIHRRSIFMAARGRQDGADSAATPVYPKMPQKVREPAAKKP